MLVWREVADYVYSRQYSVMFISVALLLTYFFLQYKKTESRRTGRKFSSEHCCRSAADASRILFQAVLVHTFRLLR